MASPRLLSTNSYRGKVKLPPGAKYVKTEGNMHYYAMSKMHFYTVEPHPKDSSSWVVREWAGDCGC